MKSHTHTRVVSKMGRVVVFSQEALPWVCPSQIGVEGFENRLFKLTVHSP